MSQGNRKARRAWARALRRHGHRGKVYHAEYQHDHCCAIFSPVRLCNCNPDRLLKSESGHVLAHVAGAGFFDPLEVSRAAVWKF